MKTCELCGFENHACEHFELITFIDSKLNSENLELWNDTVHQIQTFAANKLKPLIAHTALTLAELYFSKTGIIKHWKEMARIKRGEFTDQELKEFAEQETYEREQMMRDYTPPKEFNSNTDTVNIATWLVTAAENGKFDDEFEWLMMNRYERRLLKVNGGEQEVWQKKPHNAEILEAK